MLRILQSIVVLLTILASGVAALPPRTAHAATPAGPGTDPNFYKLAVSQRGMTKVTYEALATAGVPVTTLNPATIQIYEQGVEIARTIVDGGDGFGPGDYVLFYGRAVDTLLTTTNIYWLTYGSALGKEMTTRDATPNLLLPPATSYTETLHIEENHTWQSSLPLTGDADHWYWQDFGPVYDSSYTYYVPFTFTLTTTLTDLAPGAFTAGLAPRLRGKGNVTHLATFYLNNTNVGQASWLAQDEFLGTLNFDQTLLVNGSNVLTFTVQLLYNDPKPNDPRPKDDGYINWFELTYRRSYAAPASGQFAFAGEGAAATSLTLTNLADSATQLYDISDPVNPQRLTGAQVSGGGPFSLAFTHNAGAPARYLAAAPGQFLSLAAASISADIPSDLRNSILGADWIAITPAAFRTATDQLAAFRRTSQGLRTAVVDIQDVYDEFNGGLPDQEALRRFIRYAYENWPRPAPSYVILMGDGHVDPRNYLGASPTSWLPPYLAPVDKVDGVTAADNRYVALDPVTPVVNPMPFMALGRLPANTPADAQAMVSKIMAYESAAFDPTWNYKAVFVADAYDPKAGNFAESSDKVAVGTAHLPAEYNRQRIYYTVAPYTTATAVKNAIITAINSGALLVNYHGHGAMQAWGGSLLWRTIYLSSLSNTGKYPIMLPMTCMEGYFISPTLSGLGESIVRMAGAGAIASWSPTGKGIVAGHDIIFTAFYDAIFQQKITELGPVTTYAKQTMYDNNDPGVSQFKDLIDTYILFGDPAMTIQVPTPDVALTVQQNPQDVMPGQSTTYVLSYQNVGIVTATQVIVTDTLPAELTNPVWTASDGAITDTLPGPAFTWQLPDLPPGVSGTITITAIVRSDVSSATTITNTASISAAGEPLSKRGNNSGSVQGTAFFPTGFALESFMAFWRQAGVELSWDTRNESGLVGFNLYRSNSPAEIGKRLNQGLILPSAPPDGSGHYTYLDAGIVPGQRVYYWLEIVMADLSVTVPALAPRWPNQVYLPLSQTHAVGQP